MREGISVKQYWVGTSLSTKKINKNIIDQCPTLFWTNKETFFVGSPVKYDLNPKEMHM